MKKENKIIYRVIGATADIDSDGTEAAQQKDFNALISKRIK